MFREGLICMLASQTDIHIVGEAQSVSVAVELAANLTPDVVLLDIELPDSGAYLVASRVRAELATRTARLVALTEWRQHEDRRRSVEAGFDHHLVKPVDPLHLRVLLNSVASGAHTTEGSAPKG